MSEAASELDNTVAGANGGAERQRGAGLNEVTVHELRSHPGRILDGVAAGDPVTITRAGKPIAQLTPIAGTRLSSAEVIERFRRLSAVDPLRLRADVDSIVDERL